MSDFPDVADEWHPTLNAERKPANKTRAASRDTVWWQCGKGHEWPATVVDRTTKYRGCPYCAGKKVDASNSLATLRPDLAAEWDPTRNELTPNDVTVGANHYAWWLCATCGHSWRARVNARATAAQGCPEWGKVPHPVVPRIAVEACVMRQRCPRSQPKTCSRPRTTSSRATRRQSSILRRR